MIQGRALLSLVLRTVGFARVVGPAIGALAVLSGCATSTSLDADPHAANAGLEALASGSAPSPKAIAPSSLNGRTKLVAQPDLALNSIFDGAAPASSNAAQPGAPARPAPSESSRGSTEPASPSSNAEPAPAPRAVVAPAVTTKPVEERVREATSELRAALAERPASTKSTFANHATLAALDSLLVAGSSAAPTALDSSLSPTQRVVLSAFTGIVKGFASGDAKDGDPAAAGEVLDRAATEIRVVDNARISRAVLCRRVMGFGQYDPFSAPIFLAGRSNRALVYVEVDHLSHRAARDRDPGVSDQGWSASASDPLWAIEVSEELGLWHDADGSLQWRKPEQTVVEVSRQRRHDFYLVQAIDLPETLSVGNYKLKIVVRDKASGSTDETTLSIQIVADASGALRPTALVPPR